jgi:hypothetical protein
MSWAKFLSFLESPLFWGFIAFILAAFSVSGVFNMNVANIFLFFAWFFGIAAIAKAIFISTSSTKIRVLVFLISLLILSVGLYSLHLWFGEKKITTPDTAISKDIAKSGSDSF